MDVKEMARQQTRQARSIVEKMIELKIDEICYHQMSDEELELVIRWLKQEKKRL